MFQGLSDATLQRFCPANKDSQNMFIILINNTVFEKKPFSFCPIIFYTAVTPICLHMDI